MKKEIKIKNQVGELEKVNAFIEEIGEELQLDMEPADEPEPGNGRDGI